MITIESLIAVLFKVIIIITAHPDIPQDVKDSVFTQINQAITQENAVVNSPVSSPVAESPVVGGVVEPVVLEPVTGSVVVGQCSNFRGQEFSINTSGEWNRAYLRVEGFNKNYSGNREVRKDREIPKGESVFISEMMSGGDYDYKLTIDGVEVDSGSVTLQGCI